MRISRRGFLGSPAILLAGCAARRSTMAPLARPAPLARVQVAENRVIRTTVGLRPFRPSGFVVRGEKIGEKTVVHNYGHGGAGITLSWGTAQLAVEEGAKAGVRDCAVIGCGVVGLSTARLLQERGYHPVIYSKDLPPNTTSNLAGGLWEPVSVFDHPRVTPEFRKQFGDSARYAFRRYQSLVGDVYGVHWLPLYSLSRDQPFTPPPPESPNSEVEPLYPERKQVSGRDLPFDVPYGRRCYSMLIEPPVYLNSLIRDYEAAGGRIVVWEFHTAAEIGELPERLIFNCTGLGARSLFQDEELTPIRGQLVFLVPQPEVAYMTLGPGNTYMFPRKDGILLGGSFERGVWDTEPSADTTQRILRENGVLFNSMRSA